MTTHRLKVFIKYADAIMDGTKTFEVRKNDRGYKVGDKIVFDVVTNEGYAVGAAARHPLNGATRLVRGARRRRPDGCHRSARPMEPGAYPDTGGGGLMDTMEDILADCNEVFRYDDTRPQDRAHTYLKEHRVCRGYDDTAMERAAQDMIERAYTVGRMESSEAVARETARIIAEGIAKELGTTPGEEQTCDSR